MNEEEAFFHYSDVCWLPASGDGMSTLMNEDLQALFPLLFNQKSGNFLMISKYFEK